MPTKTITMNVHRVLSAFTPGTSHWATESCILIIFHTSQQELRDVDCPPKAVRSNAGVGYSKSSLTPLPQGGMGISSSQNSLPKGDIQQIKHQRRTHLFSEEVDRLREYLGEALWFGDREEGLEDRVLV